MTDIVMRPLLAGAGTVLALMSRAAQLAATAVSAIRDRVDGSGAAPADTESPRSAPELTPASAHALAEKALHEAEDDGWPAVQPHLPDQLPVEGWDGLSVAAVRQRIRTLPRTDLLTLLAYEKAHAGRPAIVLTLENRLSRVVSSG